ncbi:MAG: hypothetical protein ABI541_06250 [Betaproteobacteria bacterium]
MNEHVRHVADAPERLLEIGARDGALLRHPALDKPYFWEFYQVRNAIATLFRKEFSYETFFIRKNHLSYGPLRAYLQALIDNAQGRPFFQCCRTTGRLAALRDALGGTHIHLWRNPHDQWWSYRVGDYFDATTQLVFNAAALPDSLAAVRDVCGIAAFRDPDIDKEFAHCRNHRLAAREGYVAFYALWLHSLLACEKVADLSVNIDALSTSGTYRRDTLSALNRHGIDGLDFSDCSIAQSQFGADDLAFLADAEQRVHNIFRDKGIEQDHLAAALDLRARYRPGPLRTIADAAASLSSVHSVAIRQMDALAGMQRELAQRENMLADARRTAEAQRIDLTAAATLTAAQREEIAAGQAALDAREKDLVQARDRSTGLAAELADIRLRMAAMSEDLVEASARLDSQAAELASARQRTERLHHELRAAGSRLEEAGLETHRWWSMADDTSRHLQAIYASRSWKLTAPLREINAWRKRLAGSTGVGVATLGGMPRRAVRQLLLAAWAHARGRPERRARFVRLLAPFPRLYSRLRTFAFARAMVPAASAPSTVSPGAPPMRLEGRNGVRWEDYPGSVQQIHSQLMQARAAAAPPSQALPTQTRR